MRGRSLPAAALALALVGCELPPNPAPCRAWTARALDGSCAERPWTRPTIADGVGPEGARRIDVAVDAAGRALAVWQIDGPQPALAAAEELSNGSIVLRSPAARVTEGVLGFAWPRAAASPDGTAVVTWGQLEPQEIGFVHASFRDASGAWHDPEGPGDALSFPPRAYQPRLAANAEGEWIAVWDQWYANNYGVSVARRQRGDTAWTRPKAADDVLSPHLFYSNAPQIALDDAGRALSVWYQSTGGPLMVYASERASAARAFSHPGPNEILSAEGAPVDENPIENPIPVLGPLGEAAVIWTQDDTKNVPVYLATRDVAGQWTRPRDLGDTFSTAEGTKHDARMVAGPRGDLYVVWCDGAGAASELHAARRASDGRWTEDGRHPIRLSAPGAMALLPALAVGPGGGVVVVWVETLGGSARIVARRTGRAEEPWGPPFILSPEGDDADEPAVAVGPGDRAIATWVQGPFGKRRAFLAHVD